MENSVVLVLLLGLCVSASASRFQSFAASAGASKLKLSADKLEQPLYQQSVSDAINKMHPGWTAGFSSDKQNLKVKDFKVVLGSLSAPAGQLLGMERRHPRANGVLPKEFDARKQWPHCRTLTEIRDQGHCGSCWAFGATEVLSDRFCIHGNENVSLSANDLVACCGTSCGDGCDGGWPYQAWQYFISDGIVTSTCQPYFDSKGCKHPGCEPVYPTPQCSRRCIDDELWPAAKHYAESVYSVGPSVEEIQAEVLANGPVEVDFNVYADFAYYKSGVYSHVYGDMIGGHAVKLVGWGTSDDGLDYWLIANSWGYDWGEDGYFRILRGTNECEIEADVVTGMPLIKSKMVDPVQVA